MRRASVLFAFIMAVIVAAAQRLVADAPAEVAVGEQFRLTYTVNTQNVNGFRVGTIPAELEVLMGPSTSSQSSFQMVNGHTSSSSSITYTYIICANKAGTYSIPAAHISVGGKTIASNQLRIKVSGTSRQGAQGQQGQGEGGLRPAGSRISGSDLFIKVSANKRRVHEQEPILLTYKVYTLVDLTSLKGNMPDLKGFHTQEVQLPQQKSYKIETVNGRPYRTVTWSQYVMFPQITGKLEIPSITFDGIVIQQNRDVDPFEAFFNGGSGYVEVKKKIKAPGLTIQVDPLPARPAGFSGGVGSFTISAQLNKTDIKANNPVTLRVIVSGRGNLKLIKKPEVKFPKDFDTYDAKVTDKTKLTSNGVEGNMVYDFLAVPRNQGKYEIPPIEFVYYDTEANAYKTVKTQAFTLNVAKGSGSASVSDYTGDAADDQLNKDIRGIKTGDADVHDIGDFFFGSTAYWVAMCVLAAIFVSLFVVFRHRAIANANIDRMRGKKANKVATKRLKKANRLMLDGKASLFYDEVLRALWGYVGDKLSIPVEKLSRENISQRLAERSVGDETIALFIGALDECEFERYAPGDVKGNMSKTFEAAMTAIMRIEETMKKRKKSAAATATVLLLALMAWLPSDAGAITKANADSAYARQQYQQAIKDYEELLHDGVSAELYYNLGNAYYRTDNITRAVLNYERALLLSPGDGDIRFNLQMARSKTIDKITPESEMFFVTWYHALVNIMSVDGWARTALVSFALAIVLALAYLFSARIWVRKVGFFGGLAFIAVFILANLFAYQQRQELVNRTGAIIISSAVPVKSTPSKSGTDLFILHEGTKVEITDGTMRGWKEIRVADGKEGWIETSKIEII
ncbi:BatD family protein [Marseilla massiliensis]|uniref:BatD family protein n=1 Tax=Marseilla massiliensis TaxID=1841864 RepID=A0A938WNN6_9BACT|nr:BatD family protein [Marseilla massiliensis]MBM6662312.1 BatD family protein [Marseilla massiliensis]